MADAMVLKTQQWLNSTYGEDSRFVKVTENGNTGWNTIYGLRRALQIELGIQSTSTAFGPSTTAKFQERFPNGVIQQSADDETEDNIYAIIQGSLWCKGYSTGASSITKHFYSGTGNAIKELKEDAGCSTSDSSTITLNVMKALLSMDQFVKVNGGTTKIRTIQQTLNREYESYIGLAPCDGLYGRAMNTALIKVLQAIEGYSVADATGTFGSGTKAKLPIVPSGGTLSTATEASAVKLIRYALCCNGYDIAINSANWDDTLTETINKFQSDMCIAQVAQCNVDTWMSLLLSKGNPDRACVACDTAYSIKGKRIEDLKNIGINIIGRYIVGGSAKELDLGEEKTIIDNGFKLFPIFQNSGTPTLSYFNATQGLYDYHDAVKGAKFHCIPVGSIIYFAVDMDPLDTEITSNILPYFKAISENLIDYRVGIYGTRNVCTRVMEEGYAETCFVSDMSTGYSGNMGFKMPENWNLDQFSEISLTNDDGTWAIDKVAYSGKFPVIEQLGERYLYKGTVEVTGSHIGNAYKYGGQNLRVSARVTDLNNNPIDNVGVLITMKSQEPITSVYYDNEKAVYAEADGNLYTFSNTNADYEYDYMRIVNSNNYYATYQVYKNGEICTDQDVKIYIEIETEFEEN